MNHDLELCNFRFLSLHDAPDTYGPNEEICEVCYMFSVKLYQKSWEAGRKESAEMRQSLSYDPEVATATAPSSQPEEGTSKHHQVKTSWSRNRRNRLDPELVWILNPKKPFTSSYCCSTTENYLRHQRWLKWSFMGTCQLMSAQSVNNNFIFTESLTHLHISHYLCEISLGWWKGCNWRELSSDKEPKRNKHRGQDKWKMKVKVKMASLWCLPPHYSNLAYERLMFAQGDHVCCSHVQ